jgi:phage gpG-like protein
MGLGFVTIAITIDASEPLAALRILAEREADLTAPLTQVLELGLADAVATVEVGGGPLGIWAPMSHLTPVVAQKLYGRRRDPGRLLRDGGSLLESLAPGGSGNVFEVGPREGSAGTADISGRTGFPIAVGQQLGTSRTFHVLQGHGFSETGIPPRPFLGWREDRLDAYAGIFADHLFGAGA